MEVSALPTLTDNFGQLYQLSHQLNKIGADPHCAVVLDDPGVHGLHAELRAEGSKWVLVDVSPGLGVRVNEQPIRSPTELHDGDVISIGSSVLWFRQRGIDRSGTAIRQADNDPSRPSVPDLSSFRSGGEAAPITAAPKKPEEVKPGLETGRYCRACHERIHPEAEICPHCGVRQVVVAPTAGRSGKSKGTAAMLAILLGGLGAHKFYLGKPGLGIVYLLFVWTYIPTIVGFIEGIYYITLTEEKFAEKYT